MHVRCFKQPVFSAVVFVLSFLIGACTSSKAVSSGIVSGFPPRLTGENINGDFPEAVHIKTRTQTFNTYHYYLLHEGRIWYKSIDRSLEPKEWTIFGKNGVPHSRKPGFRKTDAVMEISADADELIALSAEGGLYRYCFDTIISRPSNVWLDRQGWPEAEQLYIDMRFAKNRSWAMGKRNMHVLYYEDPFGNQHHNGIQEIATTYVLLEDGQEICYADTGLPGDFSRNFIGPERGAFKAASLSASGSSIFVINEAGLMYTRIADFDIVGCDPMFFKYTYIPYTSDLKGSNYFSNLTEWGLPSEEWRAQPRIPLAGKAAITRHITILQNGQGNGARELRVAGFNEHGETGYWTKAIFADSWNFKTAPLYFPEKAVLNAAESETGQSLDRSLGGYWWNGSRREDDWTYEIPNFNILEGDCDLRITRYDETCILKLHPVELWTYLKRDYLPGRNGPPKLFFVTLEIPENAFAGLSGEFAARLHEKFAGKDRTLFQYVMAASTRYIFMRDKSNKDSVLYLTDGTLSAFFPEFRRTWYIGNYDELQRYQSPELTFGAYEIGSAEQYEELCRKIEMNKSFRRELKERIAVLRKNKISAIGLDMIYIPFHYTVRYSPLRYIDTPKMRTMTSYGDEIVLTNSAFIDVTSETRIWIDKKIIGLLDARILMFEDMAKRFEKNREPAAVPGWFSETITSYWDIAGLPRKIPGTFYNPVLALLPAEQIPAVLTFKEDETDQGYFGWYLSIGETASFSLFLDPRESAKTIYSRKGKTPQEKKVKLDCTLYANPAVNTAMERDIVERCLAPFARPDREGIDVRIVFDGDIFEIREYPAMHSSTLIFRGQAGTDTH
ncbi:MAG: hypothetical protein LBG22_10425 [Treponema sp.]|jgi:hypothetical protein|nr:hypothetical protein [Treponema sp.]